MIVGELIARLQELDQRLPVHVAVLRLTGDDTKIVDTVEVWSSGVPDEEVVIIS